MRAIKLNTHVTGSRTLSLELPPDVEQGPAEVIILVPDRQRRPHTLADFLDHLSDHPRHLRTKEEIDRQVEQERESWD